MIFIFENHIVFDFILISWEKWFNVCCTYSQTHNLAHTDFFLLSLVGLFFAKLFFVHTHKIERQCQGSAHTQNVELNKK